MNAEQGGDRAGTASKSKVGLVGLAQEAYLFLPWHRINSAI